MSDKKVSDLPSLSGANVDAADLLYIVDSSDGSSGSKKITVGQYQLAPVSGGTANGVLYLNGSKVATSGSALVFDGTNLGVGTNSPVSVLNVSGTTGFTWASSAVSSGLVTIGTQGTGGSLFVNTASLNSNFASGLAVDGTYGTPSTIVNLKAVGVRDGGGYNASLAFHTSYESTLAERMRLDSSGKLGIGTSSPTYKLDVQVSDSTSYNPFIAGSYVARVRNAYGSAADTSAMISHSCDNYASVWNAGLVETGGTYTGAYVWQNRTGSSTYAERMRLNASGNLGLGVTPSAWLGAGYIDFPGNGYVGNATGYSSNTLSTGLNAYYATGAWRYKASSLAATRFDHDNGAFAWYSAASGTAGNPISFTQTMALDASGNLKVNAIQNTSGVEQYLAKAWVNFNGTGTVAIRASGNVSSITDNGLGDYTVNFTSAMTDANYSYVLSQGGTSGIGVVIGDPAVSPTSSALRINSRSDSGLNFIDVAYVNVAIFR